MANTPTPFPPECALNKRRLERKESAQAPGPLVTTTISSSPTASLLEDDSLTLGDLWARMPSTGGKTLFEPSEVALFLRRELSTPMLDEMYNSLRFVARNNIDPLHRQLIKDRTIFITEDPRLHLVWTVNRFYVKPIPHCLLNHDFWKLFLSCDAAAFDSTSSQTERAVALGFMRSYCFLIRHRSDFALAKDSGLLLAHLKWTAWNRFIAHFAGIPDSEVAKRYHYGQIRLSRLNWMVRASSCRSGRIVWFYELPQWSTGPYIAQAVAPLLFIFAASSLMLSAMQVMVGVDLGAVESKALYGRVLWGFSIAVIAASTLALSLMVALPSLWVAMRLASGLFLRNSDRPAGGGR